MERHQVVIKLFEIESKNQSGDNIEAAADAKKLLSEQACTEAEKDNLERLIKKVDTGTNRLLKDLGL